MDQGSSPKTKGSPLKTNISPEKYCLEDEPSEQIGSLFRVTFVHFGGVHFKWTVSFLGQDFSVKSMDTETQD